MRARGVGGGCVRVELFVSAELCAAVCGLMPLQSEEEERWEEENVHVMAGHDYF